MKILAIGPFSSYSGFNTSIQRVNSLETLGHEVTMLDENSYNQNILSKLVDRFHKKLFKLGFNLSPKPNIELLKAILQSLEMGGYQIIFLDKCLVLDSNSLSHIKKAIGSGIIIGFSPDDMSARHNQSIEFVSAIPIYDLFVTTKSYNVKELSEFGVKQVLFVNNSFCESSFHPIKVSNEDYILYGADVGFIGSYEEERARSIYYLASNGIHVRVWGNGWEKFKYSHPNLKIEYHELINEEYLKAQASIKISLGFLRKMNRDLQTTRSVEIPACGCFMLAERTNEHLSLFEEGSEAEFFSSNEELLDKCRFYLANEEKRSAIARAGLKRCLISNYTTAGQMELILEYCISNFELFD